MQTTKPKFSLLKLACIILITLFVVAIPSWAKADINDDYGKTETLFFYANDASGNRVLLKAVSLDTLKSMATGPNGATDTWYETSLVDAKPAITYYEGQGITVLDYLDYVLENTSVDGAESLTFLGSDKLYFYSTDGGTANFTYTKLYGTPRYFFPDMYTLATDPNDGDGVMYYDGEELAFDADVLMNTKIEAVPYLAIISGGGRALLTSASDWGGEGPLTDYIAVNEGVVRGCLSNTDLEAGTRLNDSQLRLLVPALESDLGSIEDGEQLVANASTNIRKWVYSIRLLSSDAGSIQSQGTVAAPTCDFTMDNGDLIITLNCATEGATIYHSVVFADQSVKSTAPVVEYTEPIVIEDYDESKPFNLGVIAVKEGWDNNNKFIFDTADSDHSFTYELTATDDSPTVGTAFDLDATLSADNDYTLYGAEYSVAVPAALTVNSVSTGDGWEYGTASDANGAIVVTFTYLNTSGTAETASTAVPVGTITVKPIATGDTTVTVSEAKVIKKYTDTYTSAYSNITAEDLRLSGDLALGDVNGSGDITITDALRVCKAINHAITLTADQQTAADVNKDGDITIVDALRICKYINKVISEF